MDYNASVIRIVQMQSIVGLAIFDVVNYLPITYFMANKSWLCNYYLLFF